MSIRNTNTNSGKNNIQSSDSFDKLNSKQLLGEAVDSFMRSVQEKDKDDKYLPSNTSFPTLFQNYSKNHSANWVNYSIIANDPIDHTNSNNSANIKISSKDSIITENRELLLTISIELTDGKEEMMNIYKGQKANEVADQFIVKHNLPVEIKIPLMESIQEKINIARVTLLKFKKLKLTNQKIEI